MPASRLRSGERRGPRSGGCCFPPARGRLEGRVLEGVVSRVDGRAGWDDVVDAVQHGLVQDDVGRRQLALELLHGPRPDDRRGHGGVVEDERNRQLDEGDPRLLGEAGELLHGIQLALVAGLGEIEALREPTRARGGLLPGVLAPAARQPATGQRTVGDDRHAVAHAGGQDVGLDGADDDRVRRLLGHEALQMAVTRHPLGLHDLAGGKGRGANVADLALVDEVAERRQGLLDVGVGARPVDLVEVDPVGA